MDSILNFSMNREAEIKEGKYPYALTDVQLEHDVLTDYGIKQKISFTFGLNIDEETKVVTKKFYYSKHKDSRFMKFMAIICKAYNTKKLNLQELIGTCGTLSITHGMDDDGNVFENITEIFPDIVEESNTELDTNI